MKKGIIFYLCFVILSNLVCSTDSQKDEATVEKIPEWIRAGKPIIGSEIPETDYRYLAAWLDKHAKPAQQYIIDLFEKHQIVIIGEFHNIKEQKDFVLDLIPLLYHEAGVRCIGWEFSRHTDNEQLESLVTAREFDREAALQFARDQLGHDWNSKEHWDFIERIWQLNNSLKPGQEKLRFLGLDMDLDLLKVSVVLTSQPQDSPEFKEVLTEVLNRDKTMAQQVEKKIIDKGQKGLVFVGRCHDFTHYDFPPDINMGRDIMGSLLYKKFGDRIFQVGLGPNILPVIEEVMELKSHKPIGFDLYKSPFGNIKAPKDWYDAPGVPFSKLARGYVYLSSRAYLHKNTPIVGFVTREMFEKYKEYYEIDLGQSFNSAEELDKYWQEQRFPKP